MNTPGKRFVTIATFASIAAFFLIAEAGADTAAAKRGRAGGHHPTWPCGVSIKLVNELFAKPRSQCQEISTPFQQHQLQPPYGRSFGTSPLA